jgi:hypothetical protein
MCIPLVGGGCAIIGWIGSGLGTAQREETGRVLRFLGVESALPDALLFS